MDAKATFGILTLPPSDQLLLYHPKYANLLTYPTPCNDNLVP